MWEETGLGEVVAATMLVIEQLLRAQLHNTEAWTKKKNFGGMQ